MSTLRPLVSVGIPVYNGEKLLQQALEALFAQTYTNLEFVVVDNASIDGTEAMCRMNAEKDPRIHYYRNQKNIGVHANFRRVLELSSGEYFMWVGVDDFRPPTAIEDCLNALLANPQAVMAHGVIIAEPQNRLGQQITISNEMDLTASDPIDRIRTFTKKVTYNAIVYGLYKRSALVQGWLDSCFGQDYLLCLQMCLLGPFAYSKTPMMICRDKNFRLNPNPVYADVPLSLKNLLRVYRSPRRKGWVIMFMGCYFLLRLHKVSMAHRIRACIAHVVNFSRRYPTLLAKEIIFISFTPISYLALFVWKSVRQVAVFFPVVQKLHTLLRS